MHTNLSFLALCSICSRICMENKSYSRHVIQPWAMSTASFFTAVNNRDQLLLFCEPLTPPKPPLHTSDNPALSFCNDTLAGNWALLQHNAQHMTKTEINTQREKERILLCCNSLCCIVCKRACKLAISFGCNDGISFQVGVCICVHYSLPLGPLVAERSSVRQSKVSCK